MPYKNPEDRKQHSKIYYEKNKDRWKNSDGSWHTWKKADGSWIQSYANNPDKKREVYKKSYLKHRDKILLKRKSLPTVIKLARYYKVSKEEIEELFSKFNNECAICKSKENLCVDHNYTTNKLRGILCKGCNLFIGHAQERIALLKEGVNYLTKYGTKHGK